MTIKSMTLSAILLSLGTILHAIIPFGDLMLACIFALIIYYKNLKLSILIGLCGGFLAGITAASPEALLPNIIDKTITSVLVFYLAKLINTENILQRNITKAIIFFLATLVSGSIYLNLRAAMGGITGVNELILAMVLPTALVNIFLGLFLDKMLLFYRLNVKKI